MYLIINLVSTEVVWKLWEHSRSTTVHVRQLRARSRYTPTRTLLSLMAAKSVPKAQHMWLS